MWPPWPPQLPPRPWPPTAGRRPCTRRTTDSTRSVDGWKQREPPMDGWNRESIGREVSEHPEPKRRDPHEQRPPAPQQNRSRVLRPRGRRRTQLRGPRTRRQKPTRKTAIDGDGAGGDAEKTGRSVAKRTEVDSLWNTQAPNGKPAE
ncbi:hypothetical protein J437_LFUL000897 [Ladona fulva]|uniref:Uncharacterized protein n=1 Tax=Ladona fulva TaxID=123851 RepID=A0A8K0K814_LADFU|nr:hypothetical protein J437_LFUL000897 [Ladona fulva]